MGDAAIAARKPTRVYLDTEFTKFARPQLISVALVAESGQEFYGESTDLRNCSEFVVENVLPLTLWSRGRVVGWFTRPSRLSTRPTQSRARYLPNSEQNS